MTHLEGAAPLWLEELRHGYEQVGRKAVHVAADGVAVGRDPEHAHYRHDAGLRARHTRQRTACGDTHTNTPENEYMYGVGGNRGRCEPLSQVTHTAVSRPWSHRCHMFSVTPLPLSLA